MIRRFYNKIKRRIHQFFWLRKVRNLKLPIAKRLAIKSLASDLISVQPMSGPPPGTETYVNEKGNTVYKTPKGTVMEVGSNFEKMKPGEGGHSFGKGWFIVDENGKFVYAGDDFEKYNNLMEKYRRNRTGVN